MKTFLCTVVLISSTVLSGCTIATAEYTPTYADYTVGPGPDYPYYDGGGRYYPGYNYYGTSVYYGDKVDGPRYYRTWFGG